MTEARQTLERNRSETAIRCLEVALHANTSDDEVIAGVNGFRRIVAGKPLSDVCVEFAGSGGAVAPSPQWASQLVRENLDLRQRLETAEQRRADETENNLRKLDEELRTARDRADTAEARFADLQSAHAQAIDRLSHEILALRGALDEARRAAAVSQSKVPPFRAFLAAARHAADDGGGINPPSFTAQASGNRNAPASRPASSRAWTA